MFDFLTAAVLLFSGIFEGFRLANAISILQTCSAPVSPAEQDTIFMVQMEAMKNNAIIEIVVCAVLLLLTLICLIRFIRWAIIGNLIYMTHRTTQDFLKTTNRSSSASPGMKITNADKVSRKP